MKRRKFIKSAAICSATYGLGRWKKSAKTHALTLSFDDGFKKSFYRIAEIYEEYDLSACFNVIASGHMSSFNAVDKWILPELMGNFEDWNHLKFRGHEVMPHTWEHLNLTKVPITKAKENIDKCLDYFESHLEGYIAEEAVYNFAFNASTPELDAFALQRVRAIRTSGRLILENTRTNAMPTRNSPHRLGCWANGPDFCDEFVDREVNEFLAGPGGWLIINLHGLDEEGWGPLHAGYLDGLLKRLVEIEYLTMLPTGVLLL
ncbi:MAG: polysaccharide deacetylase family protein [Saprospiraceae bacterium]|nr:polysaccharide deacetylase family protein [Saprospiraceae bacterium]